MLHLFALGEMRLETDAGAVLSRRRKPLALLTFLARRAPRSATRVELASLLWGERPEAKSRQSLRQALLELHRLVGDRVIVTNESVRLVAPDLTLDVTLFELDVDAGRDRAAIARWTGNFCDGADEGGESAFHAWADAERAGLRRRLTLAFERLLDEAARKGDDRDSIAIARRWTTLAPLDEHASLRLVTALRRAGRFVDALAVHSSFVTRVHEELGVAPTRAFLQLARELDESARTPTSHQPAQSDDRAVPAHSSHRFVGRDAAFVSLSSAWADARAGRPAAVIVRAERGMGATRLCDELVRWASDALPSTTVLRSSRAAAPDTSFVAAGALLEPLSQSAALAGVSPDALSALAKVLPSLSRRFSRLPPLVDPSEARIAAAIREAWDAIAEDAPVIVVLDRIDEMDASSRSLLLEATRTLSGGVLVLIVAGPTTDERRAIENALDGARSVSTVTLEPLTASDVVELLASVATLDAGDARPFAEALRTETGGIPAYLIALVDSLLEDGALASGDSRRNAGPPRDVSTLPVPVDVRRIVQHRRDSLSPTALRVLDAAVVYGDPITLAVLAPLAALAAADVVESVETLIRARLLRRAGEDRYVVSPPLLQRTAYELVSPLRRESLHAVAATLVPPKRLWRRAGAYDRVTYHRARASSSSARPARRWRVVVATIVVAAGLAAVAMRWRPVASPERDATVAVFPFAVSGDSTLDYLGTGMVELLSTSLDGAAGLRTIDPRAVLAAAHDTARSTTMSLDRARDIATRLGARYFVLGTVLGAGGRVEMSASLYVTDHASVAAHRASASGQSDGLFAIVDRVTAQLAVAQGTPSSERLTQLAAITTPSLDALKAYLEGRRAYRENDLYAAIPAYQRAVAADSTFALAWYGLASAASWMLRPGVEQHAAAQAVRYSEHLSTRDRELLAGFAAFSRGAADSAERMATSVAESYDDVEAWALLGEVLYHHNWKRGRSVTESRHAWERVLALDPHYWPALEHLAEVAALEGNTRESDSLLARYERSVGPEHMLLASRALRAYAFHDAASRASIEPQLRSDRGFWIIASVWYVSVYGRDLEDAQRLARLLVVPLRPPEQQGFGRLVLAHLALARGRWREARAELAIARAHAPAEALEQQLMLSLAPPLATSSATLDSLRTELEHLPIDSSTPASTVPWPRTPNSLQPLIHAYLAGMASARTHDDHAREHALARLASAPDPTMSSALGKGFALSIRAEHERQLGHPAVALQALEQGARATPFVAAWTSSIVAQGYERFVRAELLHELGRDDDALRWYATFGENSPYDLVYLAPSLFRQARIHDARGERALALQSYRRFIELWSDCDAELRPPVDEARARVAALQ